MCADPVPHKDIVLKHADGPIVNAEPHTPFPKADFLEMEGGMKGSLAPKLVILPGHNADLDRQGAINFPELRSSPAWKIQFPSKRASSGT